MASPFHDSVPPYPGWERRIFHLSRPVTDDDVEAILNGQDEYYRTVGPGRVVCIHKFGLVEVNLVVGAREIEVWFSPVQRARTAEYVDALLATRF